MSTARRMRLARHVVRLLTAAVAGVAVRAGRRWREQKPRIWHGPRGLHVVRGCVAADRLAGFPSRAVAEATGGRYTLFADREFDVVWQALDVSREDWHWMSLADLLRYADVWVAFFDCLPFPLDRRRANKWTLRLVRLLGIRIVVVPHGMDVVYRDARATRFDWVGRLQRDYPLFDLAAHADQARWRTALWCARADVVVNADYTTAGFLPRRDVTFKWFPADTDRLADSPPCESARPLVVHAPQHRWVKGTDFLLATARRLTERGFDLELVLVEEADRDKALEMYARADVLADQFCMGAFGMLALEGLALGKPTLTYLDQRTLGDPVFSLPLVNATPDNLLGVLGVLLRVPALRARLGQAGRAAVERYQSPEAMAEVWDAIYRHVWWKAPLQLEQTRHFSKERRPRSFTEDPARPEFWPVPVADLWQQISAALAAAGWRTRPPTAHDPATPHGEERPA